MPVAIDSGHVRPGSSNSMSGAGAVVNMNAASGGSAQPVRPTTTSRRGGRSRSPVAAVVGHRLPPPPSGGGGNSSSSSTIGGGSNSAKGSGSANPNNLPNASEGGNPSSAAAAAAAAAKAYSSGRSSGGGTASSTTTTWPPPENAPPPPPPHHDENGYTTSHQSAPPPPPPHGRSPPLPYDTVPKSKGPSSSSYPPPPSNWPPSAVGPGGDPNGYRQAPPPPPRVHYDHRRGGPSSFPPQRDDYDRRYDGPPPPHRYDDRYGPPPPRSMPPGGGPPPHYPSHHPPHHHHAPPPPHHPDYHNSPYHPSHRYGGPGSSSNTSRSGGPPPHHHSQPPHRGQMPPSHHRSSASGGSSRPPPQAVYHPHYHHHSANGPPQRGRERSGMGTTLVLGGPTPIHLPKSPVVSSSSSSSKQRGSAHRDGTISSVFRGRPHETSNNSPDPDDENSPQKILLSLRTPTTSFEELKDKSKKSKAVATDASTPSTLSPQPQSSQLVLLEPQRSGEGSKVDGTIDIAPSFNLLQSFDSFGDTQYFNIDSALNADSFGLAQTESLVNEIAVAATQQVLRENSSGVNFSSQYLAPSGSGALTIGYSPVNSFGNASVAASSRRNSMLGVGGMDARSSSPIQPLGIYRSYSGATVRPLDDSHLRMSVGSFGGNSALGYNSSNRTYGGEPQTSNSYYTGPVRSHEGGSDQRMPQFYILLRKFSAAFKDCTFLLPGVKGALLDDSDINRDEPADKGMSSHDYPGGSGGYGEPGPQDIVVARRRVESSVCAFGGNLHRGRQAAKALNNREAIFRGVDGAGENTAATPPSTDTSSGSQRRRIKYEDELSSRYYENESRLSWEFEENPPVEIPVVDETEIESSESGQTYLKPDQDPLSKDDKGCSEDDQYCMSVNDDGDTGSTDKGSTSPQAKMRYRCKLCGQPKQNHRCPYQQALARSIGTMVYPAVNAFTADEPGTIAAPLSEMNNFVDIQKDGMEPSPTRPSPDRMRHMTIMSGGPMMSSTQVTPEVMRSSRPSRSPRHGNKKRMYSHMKCGSGDQGDLLFVAAMELKSEQFRVVSQAKMRKSADGYIYPALPLPYAQRKRLSDNLFSLSNEVPKLTDECAQVLREAREKDLWDLAVAELMTQVIVIIHCTERDFRFEGLRQYLLTLGIAC